MQRLVPGTPSARERPRLDLHARSCGKRVAKECNSDTSAGRVRGQSPTCLRRPCLRRQVHDSSSSTGATTTPYPCCSRSAAARAASCSPGDEDRDGAAALAGEVLEVEVGDVDPLGAERLRDPGDHTRPVGYVNTQPLELAGILVGGLQQSAPVRRRLRRSSARGSRRRRPQAPPRPARRGAGARRARRRAPHGSRGRCRPRCAGSHRRPASCRAANRPPPPAARARRRGSRPPGSEARSQARAAGGSSPRRAGRAPRGRSRPAPRRARRRTRAAPCKLSGSVAATGVRNQVAPSNSSAVAHSGPRASEPQIGCPPTNLPDARDRLADAALRRADVGDGAVGGARVEDGAHLGRQRGDGCSDDGQLRARRGPRRDRERRRPPRARRRSRGAPGRDPSRRRARPPRGARQARSTRRSGPCRQRRESGRRPWTSYLRISSATRNARSSDCRALRRGSQRLS